MLVRCSRKDDSVSSKRNVEVSECGEQIYQNTITTRKLNKGPMKIRLDDLLPEGNVRTSDIEISLTEDGEVELKFDYRPDQE